MDGQGTAGNKSEENGREGKGMDLFVYLFISFAVHHLTITNYNNKTVITKTKLLINKKQQERQGERNSIANYCGPSSKGTV